LSQGRQVSSVRLTKAGYARNPKIRRFLSETSNMLILLHFTTKNAQF